jgi:predicted FMN-binding regulatory protein PaiB
MRCVQLETFVSVAVTDADSAGPKANRTQRRLTPHEYLQSVGRQRVIAERLAGKKKQSQKDEDADRRCVPEGASN